MLRIGLLKQHENLFSNNKAFDGMTLYSLTRLESEVKFEKLLLKMFRINLKNFLNKGYQSGKWKKIR